MAHTRVTSVGVRLLNAAHPERLRRLRWDACTVSMLTVIAVILGQPSGVCVWSERRNYMPRCVNIINSIVFMSLGHQQALRVRYAPESTWLQQVSMCALVAGVLLAQLFLLLATAIVLLLLPIVLLLTFSILLLLYVAVAFKPEHLSLASVLVKAEIILSAILVGVLRVHVPPAPPLPA